MPCSLPHIGLITIFGSRLCEIVDDGCQIVKESPISSNNQMRKPSPLWVAALIVAITTAAVVALVFWNGGTDPDGLVANSDAATVVEEGDQPDFAETETRSEDDPLTAGPVDAPVALVVFSDYQCPFCALWSAETLPSMMEHTKAGDLRIEWRDLNVYGPASERAARASYAAALQDRFWEYHNELFANGERRPESELSQEALKSLADDIGLDIEKFTADMESEETAAVISANQQQGFEIGAAGTPVFVLDGQIVVGSQPTDIFEDMVADALDSEKK